MFRTAIVSYAHSIKFYFFTDVNVSFHSFLTTPKYHAKTTQSSNTPQQRQTAQTSCNACTVYSYCFGKCWRLHTHWTWLTLPACPHVQPAMPSCGKKKRTVDAWAAVYVPHCSAIRVKYTCLLSRTLLQVYKTSSILTLPRLDISVKI